MTSSAARPRAKRRCSLCRVPRASCGAEGRASCKGGKGNSSRGALLNSSAPAGTKVGDRASGAGEPIPLPRALRVMGRRRGRRRPALGPSLLLLLLCL